MKKFITTVYLIVFGVGLCLGQAVSNITISPNKVSLGQKVTLLFDIDLEQSDCDSLIIDLSIIKNEDFQKDSFFTDEYLDATISKPAEDTNSNKIIKPISYFLNNNNQFELVFIPWSAGSFFISPAKLLCRNDSVTYGKAIYLRVELPEGMDKENPDEISELKDIIHSPFSLLDYWPYALAFLLLLLLIWWFLKNKKKKVNKATVSPFWEKYIVALVDLKKENLWESGKYEDYQVKLTLIMRSYLAEKYQLEILTYTTNETILKLVEKKVNAEVLDEVKSVLYVADIVKFAKGSPEDNGLDMDFIRKANHIINTTKDD